MEFPDRVGKERYFDADFYDLECERLWPRVWQMACRLEEIPAPGDAVEYEILDQSVIVVRTDDGEVRAFQNACRHRGVKLVVGRDSCENGFVCPFHGWCYDLGGANTFVARPKTFADAQPAGGRHRPAHRAVRGVGWVRLDQPRRECTAVARLPRAGGHGARCLEAWSRCGPSGGGLSGCRSTGSWRKRRSWSSTTCSRRTRSCGSPAGSRPAKARRSIRRRFVESELHYLRTMNEGMAGMVHANDVAVAEAMADLELPADAGEGAARPGTAPSTTR